ncbi:MAG: sulfatase [Planctomycetes bacterium]|nr:sulfatase [Planctomycetota bacterium]
MNFMVVISDTLRRDFLGCYGNDWISTPNIDRFAEKCLVFDRAYSGSFPTVPHRRDVMTGRYTFKYTDWARMTPEEPVMAEMFGKAGYTTMLVADCPHIIENGFWFDKGFDGWEWIRGQESDRWKTSPAEPESPCDESKIRSARGLTRHHRRNVSWWRYEEDRFAARTMSEACRWLEDNYRENFFLYVDTFDPHEPWDAPQYFIDMYDPGYEGEVVDYPQYSYTDFLAAEELKHCRALYAAEVTLVDRWVGRLFQKVEDLGLLDNTMIVFTADHGFLLGEHEIIGKALIEYTEKGRKFSYIPLYSEISRVPWIVSAPGIKPGRTEAIVQAPDIMATFADAAGIDPPGGMDGKSFKGVVEGKKKKHREAAVSSPTIIRGGAADTQPAVTDGKWAAHLTGKKLGEGTDRAVDGLEKEGYGRQYEALLYDRENDPREETNAIKENNNVYQGLKEQFVKLLEEWGTEDKLIDAWR